MWICFRHPHTLGKFLEKNWRRLEKIWRSAKVTCQYPDYDAVIKRIQGRDVITLHISQDIQKLSGVILPFGSGSLQNLSSLTSTLCVPCRKKHKKKVDDSESWLRQEETEKNLQSPETPLLDTRQLRERLHPMHLPSGCFHDIKATPHKLRDPSWTPGQWSAGKVFSESQQENFKMCNETMKKISQGKFQPLKAPLTKRWNGNRETDFTRHTHINNSIQECTDKESKNSNS
ncbi:unnamed protein product [Pocillopora meandrina]|uniref:Uncharacterized protein n=1 Tax=Pocillopora meandrina TaxID=46732 RepID=A0AAU9XK01_9CNID|nr:unnamed protein product [Pocillopora meandrina]